MKGMSIFYSSLYYLINNDNRIEPLLKYSMLDKNLLMRMVNQNLIDIYTLNTPISNTRIGDMEFGPSFTLSNHIM